MVKLNMCRFPIEIADLRGWRRCWSELPKTISGKIRRVELREREESLVTGEAERPAAEWRDDQFAQPSSGG
jgi:hypothetical protein